jgi:hypothetical protein
MPNETAGHFQVNDGDWEYLNFILRDVQDRLDALGGNRGSTLHADVINLNGNKAINAADPTQPQDLVTKSFLEENFLAKPPELPDQPNTPLNVRANARFNIGRGFDRRTMNIANDGSAGSAEEAVNSRMLVTNNAATGAWRWSNPHEIHPFVSGVF